MPTERDDVYALLNYLYGCFPNYVAASDVQAKFNQVIIEKACGITFAEARADASKLQDVAYVAQIRQTKWVELQFTNDQVSGYAITPRGIEVLNQGKLNKNIELFKESSDKSNARVAVLTFLLAGVGVLQVLNILFPTPILTNGSIVGNSLIIQQHGMSTNNTNSLPSNQITASSNQLAKNNTMKMDANFNASSEQQVSSSVGLRAITLYSFMIVFALVGLQMAGEFLVPRISRIFRREKNGKK